MKAGLGLSPAGFDRRLELVRPSPPRWVNRVEVRSVCLAGAAVDLSFERGDDGVRLAEARVDGDAEVVSYVGGTGA